MANVLGLNGVFHDPSAALVVDGTIVAAAEEERFSRRKHGKSAVPFSTWELPEAAIRFCLDAGGIEAHELDAIAYSYDPSLADAGGDIDDRGWEPLRTRYVQETPGFLRTILPGFDPSRLRFVAHHLSHAGSAFLASPCPDSDVLVFDGRGERGSYLSGRTSQGRFELLGFQSLPHSLGLLYEELTVHLGFQRASDEYKVMAMASYGAPKFLDAFRKLVTVCGGRFEIGAIDFSEFAPRRAQGSESFTEEHAHLASSVQCRLEEVLIEIATWLQHRTGNSALAMAGGVALNCVANSRLVAEGPYRQLWVQPAAGDAGSALGAALVVARELGDHPEPMRTAALGSSFSDEHIRQTLEDAGVRYERPGDLSRTVARELARGAIVGWFEGRSEFGPRALGHRSLLADPRDRANLERLNAVKGREQFRPVAPMVLEERAREIFEGPVPSPYMLFVHRVRAGWERTIPAVVHVDGTARAQTVDRKAEPKIASLLDAFECETGVPVLINTSFNTAGRPIVDSPKDALEVFGSAPLELLVLGPYLVRRRSLFDRSLFGKASS